MSFCTIIELVFEQCDIKGGGRGSRISVITLQV